MTTPFRPRLVPCELQEVTCDDGERLVVLRDPTGIAGEGLGLSPGAFWVAAQLDGTRTPTELLQHAKTSGATLGAAELSALLDALAEAGFLEGPTREVQRERSLREYRAQPARPPSCAGSVYPAEPAALREALDEWLGLDGAAAPAPTGPLPAAPVRLIVAPHIDYARGSAGYAQAYRALAATDADLFVVFGTAHATPPHLFTLTRLDHETPLGPVHTDRAALARLVADLGEDELFGDELAHRDEHSIELQLVVLQHLVRRPFTVLPVLCSSLSEAADPAAATARFLGALGRAVAGRRVCYVAGADLAHVGPMYGDPRPASARELAGLADEDRRTLAELCAGDAAAFHRDATRDDHRRRLCGTAPIYAALRASGVRPRLLHYEQWTDGVDSVSFAAAAG
ncbi:MAG TPA: AmmeMemoRadiSam system protein B [Anaeromyxobacter sp.]|nr:AmmeMemoRadiSam system protein B [Anaeromyxobacter sp.]